MNYRDFLQKVIYVMINPLIKAMIKDWNHAKHRDAGRFYRQYFCYLLLY